MSIRNFILKFFSLQGYRIKGIEVEGKEILVRVELKRRTGSCPGCGKRSRRLHQYQREQKVCHKIVGEFRVYLVGRKRRWWCERCKKAFTEEWPAVRKWSRRTVVAEAEILRLLRDNSFRRVEERYGISDEVSRLVLKRVKIGSGWEAESRERKIRLGIDEHSFRGRDLVITVTNLRRHRVVAVLPDDRQETLRRFMSEIPYSIRRRVEEVCVDMKPGFIEVVKQQLSGAALVIDRFHVVQDGNRRLDEARRIEQEAVRKPIKKHLFLKAEERLSEKERQLLDYYLREYPALREWYWYKEQVRRIYWAESKEKAREQLASIIRCLEASDDAALNDWGRMLRKYQEYILNYFNHKTTNAYTEGAHTKMKLIKRLSYGYRNEMLPKNWTGQ
jgi:transposase